MFYKNDGQKAHGTQILVRESTKWGTPLQDQGKGLKTMGEGRLRRQTRPLPIQSHFGPVCHVSHLLTLNFTCTRSTTLYVLLQ